VCWKVLEVSNYCVGWSESATFLSLILSSMSNTFLNNMLTFVSESQAGAVSTLWGSTAKTWIRPHLCFFVGTLASLT
jgi:hypothetical protein